MWMYTENYTKMYKFACVSANYLQPCHNTRLSTELLLTEASSPLSLDRHVFTEGPPCGQKITETLATTTVAETQHLQSSAPLKRSAMAGRKDEKRKEKESWREKEGLSLCI